MPHRSSAYRPSKGAIAYVYLADRSRCGKKAKRCDFSVPPRFEEDVLVAAEAFHSTSHQGKHVPKMKGTLDLLARRPTPFAEYLGAHPHPSYVAFEQRLRELAVGPLGERAGDVLLLANNGNRDRAEDRYYFSFRYRSWHGSPSRKDSEVPLIVAHPGKTRNELARETKRAIGEQPRLQKITDLLLALRFAADPAVGSHSKR